jgi:hypothetical protein
MLTSVHRYAISLPCEQGIGFVKIGNYLTKKVLEIIPQKLENRRKTGVEQDSPARESPSTQGRLSRLI